MVTAEHYQELIMNFISLLEVDEQDCWFQQDGAMVHTANSIMQMLSKLFDSSIIETCGPLNPQIYHHWISIFGGF
jgi:hypothetical protein